MNGLQHCSVHLKKSSLQKENYYYYYYYYYNTYEIAYPAPLSCTNVIYPITTFGDCKSMNLIYQLQRTESKAFYIGETGRSLSDRINGLHYTRTVSNPDLPAAIHT